MSILNALFVAVVLNTTSCAVVARHHDAAIIPPEAIVCKGRTYWYDEKCSLYQGYLSACVTSQLQIADALVTVNGLAGEVLIDHNGLVVDSYHSHAHNSFIEGRVEPIRPLRHYLNSKQLSKIAFRARVPKQWLAGLPVIPRFGDAFGTCVQRDLTIGKEWAKGSSEIVIRYEEEAGPHWTLIIRHYDSEGGEPLPGQTHWPL
jgi:hypothetical protein